MNITVLLNQVVKNWVLGDIFAPRDGFLVSKKVINELISRIKLCWGWVPLKIQTTPSGNIYKKFNSLTLINIISMTFSHRVWKLGACHGFASGHPTFGRTMVPSPNTDTEDWVLMECWLRPTKIIFEVLVLWLVCILFSFKKSIQIYLSISLCQLLINFACLA